MTVQSGTHWRRELAILWLGLVLLLGWSLCGVHAQPASQVVVYDASGSMYRADTGEFRFKLAQAVISRLASVMQRNNVTVPTGMVIFGRQYFQALNVCHDIEVPVPVPPIGTPNEFDRMVSEAMRTRPNGLTPLFDSIATAAEKMPPQGGVITVVTDLDEETCGPPPCDVVARLEAIGKPLHTVVEVGFIVATGLQAGRNSQAVEAFAKCVNAQLRYVDTLPKAAEVANEIAASLAASRPLPPIPAPAVSVPAQVSVADVGIVLKATLTAPTIWPDWTFQEAGALVRFNDRFGLQSAPLRGNLVTVRTPPGPQTFNLFPDTGGQPWGSAMDVVVQAGQTMSVAIPVAPGVIEGSAVPSEPGQSLSDLSFNWTVSGYNRHYLSQSHGPNLSVTVPPGTYEVDLIVSGDAARGIRSFAAPSLTVTPAGRVTKAFTVQTRRLGTLNVGAQVASPAFFAPAGVPALQFVITDERNREFTIGRGSGPFTRDLEQGRYHVVLRLDAEDGPSADVQVAAGETTSLDMQIAPSRLVLHLKRADGMLLTSPDEFHWEISRSGSSPTDTGERGAVLDTTLPPGQYHVTVSSLDNGVAEDTINVRLGRVVERTLVLQR